MFDLNSACTNQNSEISEISSGRPELRAVHCGGFLVVVVKPTRTFPTVYNSTAESYPDVRPYHWSDSEALYPVSWMASLPDSGLC